MSADRKRAHGKVQLDAAQVRRLALSFPETQESAHMGHPDFRVRNKIFATLSADERHVNMKIDPANLDALTRRDPDTFRDVWAGRWVGMDISRVDAELLRGLLEDAWLMTAPKSLVKNANRDAKT